jgi:hypothetical protein
MGQIIPYVNDSGEKCFFCKIRDAYYFSLLFGKPLCSRACSDLLYIEWFENERFTDAPYNIFEAKHPLT